MEKRATSLIRALARAGVENNGVAGRLLKRLVRRGFRGFDAPTVNKLRSIGMLPPESAELHGFERGTMRMLETSPQKLLPHGPYRSPFKIVDSRDHGDSAHVSFRRGEVVIPDLPFEFPRRFSLDELTARRHEAREYIRGLKAISREKDTALLRPWGVHMPGVLHDERIFTNAILNRLGLNFDWHVFGSTPPVFRTKRELFIGDKPLSYEMCAKRDFIRSRRKALRDLGILGRIFHPWRAARLDTGNDVPNLSKRVREILSKDNTLIRFPDKEVNL